MRPNPGRNARSALTEVCDNDAIEPGVDEVLQRYEATPAVPVKVVDPVRVHELPVKTSALGSTNVTTTAYKLVSADPRRKSVLVFAETQALWVGYTRAAVAGATGFSLPASAGIRIEHDGEVWVAAKTGTALVSYAVDNWAE